MYLGILLKRRMSRHRASSWGHIARKAAETNILGFRVQTRPQLHPAMAGLFERIIQEQEQAPVAATSSHETLLAFEGVGRRQ